MNISIKFSNLTQRERILILSGGLFLIFLLLYVFFWVPFSHALDKTRQENITQKALHQWVVTTFNQIQQLKARGIFIQDSKRETLLSALQQTVIHAHLERYISQTQERSGKMMFSFKKVPFDQLMSWLDQVWKQYAVQVTQINVIKGNVSGIVQASIVIE